jgi:hypothetical protein
MTKYDWPAVREKAIELFGGVFPQGELEQDVIDAFQAHPAAVVAAIKRISERYSEGKVRAPWPVLRVEAQRMMIAPAAVVGADGTELADAIETAEAWISNAGCHFDREDEVATELFERGPLRYFAEDEQLQARMLELWREQRPRGELVEQEAEERAARLREVRGIEDWKPPKGFTDAVKPVTKGHDLGVGRCEDCRAPDVELVRYGARAVCRGCAAKRDRVAGLSVPEGATR